nr:MAG TPA: hypothetical protein [Caudoviricetes sp.]
MQNTIQTSQKQTSPNIEDVSMYSAEVSHANLSALQVNEREQMTTVTSGRKCYEQFGKSYRLGLSVKMLVESSRWYSPARRLNWVARPLFSEKITKMRRYTNDTLSKQYVQTLSVRDIPSSRYLFQLVPSVRHTEEIGFGLLPTVQTQGLKVCNKQGKTVFMPLDLLPTPVASDGQGGAAKVTGKKIRRASGQVYSAKLRDLSVSNLLPTPRANKVNGINLNNPQIAQRNKGNLEESVAKIIQAIPYEDGKTSQLNPLFVAEMMGFPPDWTELPFLSGEKKA